MSNDHKPPTCDTSQQPKNTRNLYIRELGKLLLIFKWFPLRPFHSFRITHALICVCVSVNCCFVRRTVSVMIKNKYSAAAARSEGQRQMAVRCFSHPHPPPVGACSWHARTWFIPVQSGMKMLCAFVSTMPCIVFTHSPRTFINHFAYSVQCIVDGPAHNPATSLRAWSSSLHSRCSCICVSKISFGLPFIWCYQRLKPISVS